MRHTTKSMEISANLLENCMHTTLRPTIVFGRVSLNWRQHVDNICLYSGAERNSQDEQTTTTPEHKMLYQFGCCQLSPNPIVYLSSFELSTRNSLLWFSTLPLWLAGRLCVILAANPAQQPTNQICVCDTTTFPLCSIRICVLWIISFTQFGILRRKSVYQANHLATTHHLHIILQIISDKCVCWLYFLVHFLVNNSRAVHTASRSKGLLIGGIACSFTQKAQAPDCVCLFVF